MKRVVLCEGRRDVRLVKRYYERRSGGVRVTDFIAEEVQYSRLKNQESKSIRNFLESRNPYDVLAKSENGKPDLLRIFTKLVNFLVHSDAAVCLLVDLDDGMYDSLIADLANRVRTNYEGQRLSIEHGETVDESEVLMAAKSRLVSDGELVGTFDILAFYSNLERALDIREDDSITDEGDKIRSFVEDLNHSSPMWSLLD